MRSAIQKAYFIFMLLLPFVFCTESIDPVLMPRQLYMSVFILLIVALVISQKNSVSFFKISHPVYVAIGFHFLFFFCAFFGNSFTSESHYILSKQLLLFSFLILTTALLNNKFISSRDVILSGIGFGIIATGSAAVQIYEKTIAGQNLFHRIDVINGLFANKNLLSSILFLSLPFFLIGLRFSKLKWFSVIGLLGAFSIIVIIRTRVVLAATAIFVLILLYFYLRNSLRVRNKTLLIASISSFLGLFFIYKGFLEEKIGNLKSSYNPTQQYLYRVFNAKTLRSRSQFWENSIAMFQDHPMGVGAGNWQVQFPKYGLNQFGEYEILNGTSTLQRPHNDLLHLLCESGIFGFAAYCAIFGIAFYQLYFLIKNAVDYSEKWKYSYILAAVTGYLIITFFDFPMERIEHQVLLMLLLSLVFSSYNSQLKRVASKNNTVFLYCVVGVAVYSGLISFFRFKGEQASVKMYVAKNNKQWDETIYEANRASSYFYKIDPTSIPIDWYRGTAYFNRKEFEESIRCFEIAYKAAPHQIQVINNLAVAYQSVGRKEEAIALYLKALKISAQFEEARLNLAAMYFNEKNYQAAFATIDSMDINSKNEKYNMFLVPILAKEVNRILAQNANPEIIKTVSAKITTAEQITTLYFNSKMHQTSFEKYVLDTNNFL